MLLSSMSITLTLAFTPLALTGGGCPDGQVEDCADDDCIDDFYIGDGFCDGQDQLDGANLCCYDRASCSRLHESYCDPLRWR